MRHLIDWDKMSRRIFKENTLRNRKDMIESSYYFNLIMIFILIIGAMFLFQKYYERKENLKKSII
jgi:hypothetical protein